MNLQNRERLTDLENEHMVVGGRMGGRDREFGKDVCTYVVYIRATLFIGSLL